jgi:hypothetical protein
MKNIFAVSASIEFERLEHTFNVIEGIVIRETGREYACNTSRGIEWIIKNKLNPDKPYQFDYYNYSDGAYVYFWGFEYDEDNENAQKKRAEIINTIRNKIIKFKQERIDDLQNSIKYLNEIK